MSLDFNDTSIAYARMSDTDLKKAQFLFRLISSPKLVNAGKQLLNGLLRIHFPVEWAIKSTVYHQFVGGEELEHCSQIINLLSQYNVKSILDYSVEAIQDDDAINKVLNETLRSIRFAAKNPDIPFAVFKPSAFIQPQILDKIEHPETLSQDEHAQIEQFKNRIDILCHESASLGQPILIDAEHTWYQGLIDEIAEEMMLQYNKEHTIVYNTLQMYRIDRISFLQQQIQKAHENGYLLGLKFVRGAYMEKERDRARKYGYASPIHPDKTSTDRAFNEALKISIENMDVTSIFCGTHNEESCLYLTQLMQERDINKNNNNIWFSQLYGMSDHISFNLAMNGYNVAKYIPYGPVKNVMPYLIRRAEENTSVAGQTSRELRLLQKEIERRKLR